jgi:excisionase family DNA binding protein
MSFNATASNDYLTIAELAAQWRCTEQHISQLIKRGALPAFRVGRRVIVRKESAQSFLERNATASAVAA